MLRMCITLLEVPRLHRELRAMEPQLEWKQHLELELKIFVYKEKAATNVVVDMSQVKKVTHHCIISLLPTYQKLDTFIHLT